MNLEQRQAEASRLASALEYIAPRILAEQGVKEVKEAVTLLRELAQCAPLKRKPLAAEKVRELCEQLTMEPYQVRAVEAAHNIKDKP